MSSKLSTTIVGATPALTPEVQQAKLRFGIVGNAQALIAAVSRAVRVAPIDLSVLVTGESGSGKEFFPQIIHAYSPRKHARYIAVNCGAIPEGTIDSELFGHEKGSFTGAVASRKGYFEEANGGTIFLDEVAELPMTTQARLLRVLETGEFLKVGSSTVQKTNIRIVAATNVDLRRAIDEGRFREDLYYRLSTVQITVPPLRDRGADINLLARKFATDFAERYHMPEVTFSDDARGIIERYRWPGNVRQLKNVIDQMALFEAGSVITAETIESYLPTLNTLPVRQQFAGNDNASSSPAYEREREMLFNMIFNLRQRIDELTARLDDNKPHIEQPRITPSFEVITAHDEPGTDERNEMPIITQNLPTTHANATLAAGERELIRQALARNEGRRKNAAQELNISERTLYRKIKEYGLD